MGTAQPLEYGRAKRPRRVPLWTLIVGPAMVLLVLIRMGYPPSLARYVDQTIEYYKATRELHPFMHYTAPADQVVISESTLPPTLPVGALKPGMALDPPSSIETPFSIPGGPPLVFRHSRVFNGKEYLISVNYVRHRSGIGPHFAVNLTMPGTLNSWPIQLSPFVGMDIPDWFDKAPKKIFAGQIDPNDDSHFTIHYEVNGKPSYLDGWLVPATPADYPRPVNVKIQFRTTGGPAH